MTDQGTCSDTSASETLRAFAVNVAAHDFGIAQASVSLLSSETFNTIFAVTTNETRYVLRVGGLCRIHSEGTEDAEAAWLRTLLSTSIHAPEPVPTVDGQYWVERNIQGESANRFCSMFTWIDGELLVANTSVDRLRATGRLHAELHEQADASHPHDEIPRGLFADRVVYFHDENRVATYDSRYGSLLVEATERIQLTLNGLWASPPHQPHLLHGDFGPANILVDGTDLMPIDFQDLQFGFEQQDLAITLADLERAMPDMIEPYLAGYSEVRLLPEMSAELEDALVAGRSLNQMNLGLHLRRPGLRQYLESHEDRVAAWMNGETATR